MLIASAQPLCKTMIIRFDSCAHEHGMGVAPHAQNLEKWPIFQPWDRERHPESEFLDKFPMLPPIIDKGKPPICVWRQVVYIVYN